MCTSGDGNKLTKRPVAMKAKVTMGLKWAPLAGAAT